MVLVIALFVIGWVAVAVLGTQAYFRGEQSKPIHERNWRSDSFQKLSESVTGTQVDFSDRRPAYPLDEFASAGLPDA